MRLFCYTKPSPHTLGKHIREAVIEKQHGAPPLVGPVNLRMRFIFQRDPELPRAVPQLEHPPTYGLVRAVMNELCGVLYHEEKQVVSIHAIREYGNVNGVEVRA